MSLLSELLEGKKYPTDLILVGILTVLGAACAIALPDGNIIRIVLGVPMLLFYPGYALVSFLWPENLQATGKPRVGAFVERPGAESRKSSNGITGFERVVLSIGLSLALIVFIGLLLDRAWTISDMPLLTMLAIAILGLSALAHYRRSRLPEASRYAAPFGPALSTLESEWRTNRLPLLSILIATAISVSALAYVMTAPKQISYYTEFYILDQNSTLADIPRNLTVNDTASVIIGVVSHEELPTFYTIHAELVNETGARQNRSLLVQNITLDPDGMSEIPLEFRIYDPGQYRVDFWLFADNEPMPYHELHFRTSVA